MQTELERWVAMGTVGCRTIKPGVQETKVYWIKRHTQDTLIELSPKVNAVSACSLHFTHFIVAEKDTSKVCVSIADLTPPQTTMSEPRPQCC